MVYRYTSAQVRSRVEVSVKIFVRELSHRHDIRISVAVTMHWTPQVTAWQPLPRPHDHAVTYSRLQVLKY
jgi:hypothetical protein